VIKSPVARALMFCTLAAAAAFPAKESKKDLPHRIVGTWRLISSTVQYPDGRLLPDPNFGPSAKGYLFYDSSGHMCIQLMNPNRFDWRNPTRPTAQQLASAINGYYSYCGTYELRENDALITHHVELALVPNEVGTSVQRQVTFADDRLNLIAEGSHDGQRLTFTLTWERVN
jgi:Lipocalin-like domain